MCQDCGCSETGAYTIDGERIVPRRQADHRSDYGHVHAHDHVHSHEHDHAHHHDHPHSHPCEHGHSDRLPHDHGHQHDHPHSHHHPHPPSDGHHIDPAKRAPEPGDAPETTAVSPPREIAIQQDILAENNRIAAQNRAFLRSRGLFCLNWISAPGSGKTALLERIIRHDNLKVAIAVIEGDQQTDADAARIRTAGAQAVQINTGAACHLDAGMVHQALQRMNLPGPGWLMIENVGNMVCPTAFDLGEDLKIAVISCPEGDDKPIKYPDLVIAAQVLLINKTDLLPHLEFDLEKCRRQAEQINPQLVTFPVSAKTGEGLPAFIAWLIKRQVSP